METITALASKVPNEAAAYRYLERLRWKGRPVCPHCGVIDGHYLLKPKVGKRTTSTGRVTHRRLWKCHACRKQFSVLVGTIFHGTKISIRTWLFVLLEMCASKNGIAAREVQRKYGLTPKSAWFMTQRIREAMVLRNPSSLIGTIVADEAYIGGRSRHKYGTIRGEKPEKIIPPKAIVLTLVHRESGTARSRVIPNVTSDTLGSALLRAVDVDRSRLFTDDHKGYDMVGRWFALGHETVNHGWGEYVRGEVSTNAAENFFSQLKRSIDGTFHAVSHVHLHRYLAEFDFRYNTRHLVDSQRVSALLGRIDKRRLTYAALTGQAA
ncbi:MAG TPA: IS1595 family transposase [Acidimicrobiia bacterium]|jgi:transposase-like protein